jgi:hypothetical protein
MLIRFQLEKQKFRKIHACGAFVTAVVNCGVEKARGKQRIWDLGIFWDLKSKNPNRE